MEVQSPSFQPSTSPAQFVSPMFMPYIEGPKMDWTVNDGLYYTFLEHTYLLPSTHQKPQVSCIEIYSGSF